MMKTEYTIHHLPTTPAPPGQWEMWRTAVRAHAFANTPIDPDRPYEVESAVAISAFEALFAATRDELVRAAMATADADADAEVA